MTASQKIPEISRLPCSKILSNKTVKKLTMVWQRMMNLMSMRTVTAFSVHDLRGSSADDDNDNDDGFVLRRKMQSGGLYNKIRGDCNFKSKKLGLSIMQLLSERTKN